MAEPESQSIPASKGDSISGSSHNQETPGTRLAPEHPSPLPNSSRSPSNGVSLPISEASAKGTNDAPGKVPTASAGYSAEMSQSHSSPSVKRIKLSPPKTTATTTVQPPTNSEGQEAFKAEDARLQSLKAGAEVRADSASPSSSRQSTPSLHSPTVADTGVGGAKRRRDDDRKSLPRNIDSVYYGDFEIKTWYHSPYPLEDDHHGQGSATLNGHGALSTASPVASSSSKGKARAKTAAGAAAIKPASHNGLPWPAVGGHADSVPPSPQAQVPAGPVAPGSGTNSSADSTYQKLGPQPKVSSLYICEGCFKYMRTYAGWNAHRRECRHKHPPGRKVYQRGAHTIWEVDGAKEKLYAQNLSLFGKLFIDHKTIFFDVEPFWFYVVTDASVNFDFVLGYFSKEKMSYDEYNLACITTFPPYQKKGYGTLMIEFSYYLSARTATFGTPERPLSELGFKGYVSYWSAVVLRALALAFNEDDPEVASRLLPQAGPLPAKPTPTVSRFQKKAAVRIRAMLLGVRDPTEVASQNGSIDGINENQLSHEERQELRRLRRSALGWAGELPPALAAKLASFGSSPSKAGANAKKEDEEGVPAAAPASETSQHAPIQISLVKQEDEDSDSVEKEDKPVASNAPGSSPPADATSSTPPSGTPLRVGPDRAARHLTPVSTHSANPLTGVTPRGSKPTTETDPSVAVTNKVQALAPLANSQQSHAIDLTNPLGSDKFALATTLDRISRATDLRPEDAAFALSECGLLKWRVNKCPESVPLSNDVSGQGPYLVITREAVKTAILARKIKRPVLDLQYVFM
ncbi:unnamed protein product [Sympodiomycopsis kandeliae]